MEDKKINTRQNMKMLRRVKPFNTNKPKRQKRREVGKHTCDNNKGQCVCHNKTTQLLSQTKPTTR